jgi:hypothetical protein
VSETSGTFGARYAALGSIEERLALETSETRRAPYVDADAVLGRLINTALRGGRIAKVIEPKAKKRSPRVELLIPLSDSECEAAHEYFEVGNQEKRGSWHVPENEVLSLGLVHTVHWTRQNSKLALNLADSERVTPLFRGEPEAVAVWVLEPLFEELFLPLKLRGMYWLGKKTVEEQEKHWAVIDPLYAALGLDPAPLDAFRPGKGWSRHSTQDIIGLREGLIESWARAPEDVGARYRAYRLGQIIERYYAKAKKGHALRKGVLTKAAGRTLTAYFGGDWLGFLRYLDEEPHPSEEIIQALPETKLMVGTSEKAAAVAAEHGLPPEEVQRMLAAYWQQTDHSSPVEQRVVAIKRFWQAFDDVHARQQTGMPSLWGLVDEGLFEFEDENSMGYHHGRHRELLPADLNADIEQLWGGAMLPRWPERVVSEPAPHARLAEAIGPALRFWHGAALTAWFLCEGPYSRTDMDGLANYHHRELDALNELRSPIGGELFRELRDAEKRLQPIEPDYEDVSEHEVVPGLSFSVSISSGQTKLKGFEELRDIITRHRRTWTQQYFDTYLRARWESDLREAGDAYNRLTAQRGKSPTAKQFAKAAARPTNLWFGGNITGVYSVLGLKSPVAPTERRLLPTDAEAFALRVFQALGGQPRDGSIVSSREERHAQWEHNNRYANYHRLATHAPDYVQLEEALGRPPELKEFGTSKFKHRAEVLADDVEEAWHIYGDVVHRALAGEVDEREVVAPTGSVPQQAVPSSETAAAAAAATAAVAEVAEASTPPATAAPGWYEDPWGRAHWRWWDGQQWTEHAG